DLTLLAFLQARHAGCPEEAFDGLVGCADLRPLALLRRVRLPYLQTVDRDGQSPRCDEGASLARAEARTGEALGQQPPEILRCPRLHACRDLLGEEFDEQFGHRLNPPRRDGRVTSATPL